MYVEWDWTKNRKKSSLIPIPNDNARRCDKLNCRVTTKHKNN